MAGRFKDMPCYQCPDRVPGKCQKTCPDLKADREKKKKAKLNEMVSKGYHESDHYRDGWQFSRKGK